MSVKAEQHSALPTEILANVVKFSSGPSSPLHLLSHGVTQEADIGYFPVRDQDSLNTMLDLCLVNKTFLFITRPFLLETVHLFGIKDISAFCTALVKENRLEGKHVRQLFLGYVGSRKEDKHFVKACQEAIDIFRKLVCLQKLDVSYLACNFLQQGGTADQSSQKLPYIGEFWCNLPVSITYLNVGDMWQIPFEYLDENGRLSGFYSRLSNLKSLVIDSFYNSGGAETLSNGETKLKSLRFLEGRTALKIKSTRFGSLSAKEIPIGVEHLHAEFFFTRATLPPFWNKYLPSVKFFHMDLAPSDHEMNGILKFCPHLSYFSYLAPGHGDMFNVLDWNRLSIKANHLATVVVSIEASSIISNSTALHLLDPNSVCLPDWQFSSRYETGEDKVDEDEDEDEDGGDGEGQEEDQDEGKERKRAKKSTSEKSRRKLVDKCQNMVVDLTGLRDTSIFPQMKQLTVCLQPYPDYPREDMRRLIEEEMKVALMNSFGSSGINISLCWASRLSDVNRYSKFDTAYLLDKRLNKPEEDWKFMGPEVPMEI